MMKMWVKAYLERIGYHGPINPNQKNLAGLHQAHMYSVPFENLDIQRGIALSLDLNYIKQKIIDNNRGGFCYELNYLFAALLTSLGYSVTLLSGRVFDDKGVLGSEFDHMTLLVETKDSWLVDVGFGGSSFIRPLSMQMDVIQKDQAGFYKFKKVEPANYQLLYGRETDDLKPLYNFSTSPQVIESFQAQCSWKQVDVESHFVKDKICTIATPEGRKSLLNDSFTTRVYDQISTRPIVNAEMEMELLAKHFNINF